jgi:hypothetical protein
VKLSRINGVVQTDKVKSKPCTNVPAFEFANDITEFFNAKKFRLDKLNEATSGNVITIGEKFL